MKPQDRENLRYSKGFENPVELEEHIMFSFLPESRGGRLLDIGCGEGTVSLELQKHGFDVYGIDFSSVAAKKAKEKGINAIEHDVDKDGIPFEDNFFDIVWAGDVIEHVFDPIFLLREMHRVVKKTGKALITIPNDMNLTQRFSIFFSGKSPQSYIYRKLRQCKHHTLFSLELLEYMLSEAKLLVKSMGFIIRFPKTKTNTYSNNKLLGKLFGQVVIVEAYKS